MSETIKQAVVRIRNHKQEVVGSGFLISSNLVLTCAHVIDRAETPIRAIHLDFAFARQRRTGWVISRLPGDRLAEYPPRDGLDIALLRLQESPPDGCRPVRLVLPGDVWDDDFRAFGFPNGHDEGVWIKGKLRDTDASGWGQLDAAPGDAGYFVAPGFSGAPVWDQKLGGVVGMIVAADRSTTVKAAFMIPTPMLLNACPDLRASEVGRELYTRKSCLLIKPRVERAEGWKQQHEDVREVILPAIEAAGLTLPDYAPEGLLIDDLSRLTIQRVSESMIVVVDANSYEKDCPFTMSPFLYYFLGLRHARGNRTILVGRTLNHLPPNLQQGPHSLSYETRNTFNRALKDVVTQILALGDEQPDNPIQEYEKQRALEEEVTLTRKALASTRQWADALQSHLSGEAAAPPDVLPLPPRPRLTVIPPPAPAFPAGSRIKYRRLGGSGES
jgi:hypothetical protein